MIKKNILKSGDKVSFMEPDPQADGRIFWKAIRGLVEQVFPNGDFVLVDDKGLSPVQYSWAWMGHCRNLVLSPGTPNRMHRYPFNEQVSRVS